ncbi:uncharacterized protein LOC110097820 isoform X2 [Dendrobium catenatum]|uniref:uncharacterized protein LOC110097820 isoform X2 n=1 Tax=Dendrobium catenatum TaxID=906689 RepID=UPI0009F35FA9|nr:uncharacterized protein LOC110097820 isoform X2 [Dendrobium catenatum]
MEFVMMWMKKPSIERHTHFIGTNMSRWELARYEVLAMMKKLFMKERNGRNYQTSLPRNLCQYSTAIQTCRSATESLSVLIGTSFSQSCGWQRINGQHAILRQERDEGK